MNDAVHVMRVLVDEAIEIERRMKADKLQLDSLKARIQTHAFAAMQDKNLKYRRVYGSGGYATVTYKTKFDLLNYVRLQRAVGDIAKDHVKRAEEVKYDAKAAFKSALIAVYEGDYGKEITIEDILRGLGLNDKQIKTAKRRLKGDYNKDKALLQSFGAQGELEEELDAIRRYRTAELVESYFGDLTPLQIDEIRRAVNVEQELTIGLEYET